MFTHLPFALSFMHSLILAMSYSSHEPNWDTLASVPIYPRQEHVTLFLPPSVIAILGGIIPSNDSTLLIPVATTPIMQFYSLTTNTWSSRAPLPIPLNHINAAVVDGRIYSFGGLGESENDSGRAWRAVSDSWVYDPSTDIWTALSSSIPSGEERGSAAIAVYGSMILLAGGMTDLEFYGNRTQSSVSVVSIFDTITQTWLEVPKAAKHMPEARDHAGAAVLGSKIYVLGGRVDGQENVRDTVFFLDLCDLEAGWTTSKAGMPTARGGIAASIIGQKVYTFGGEGDTSVESGVFDEVEAYDTVADIWESAGSMKIPRHGTCAVAVDGKIYIPGGGILQGGGPVADFDVFTP